MNIIGGVTLKAHLPCILSAVVECLQSDGLDLPDGPLTTMYRAEINGNLYYSKQYMRVKKRNSHTVSYNLEGSKCFGFIECYIFVHNRFIAVIKHIHPLQVTCKDYFHLTCSPRCCDRIVPVTLMDSFSAVFIPNIIEKCLFIDFGYQQYIATFPSSILFD